MENTQIINTNSTHNRWVGMRLIYMNDIQITHVTAELNGQGITLYRMRALHIAYTNYYSSPPLERPPSSATSPHTRPTFSGTDALYVENTSRARPPRQRDQRPQILGEFTTSRDQERGRGAR